MRVETTPENIKHYFECTPEEWHELRSKDLTSTDIAALFGISPYLTPFELWHRKKNKEIPEFTQNERMKWGTRLESAIATGICQDNNWHILRRKDEYIRVPELRLGASFDFEINNKAALLEIKNVGLDAYARGWLIDGDNVQAPPHIELQVQHQMLVSGINKAYIGALIGGNEVRLIYRERDENIMAAIVQKSSDFWRSIDDGRSPKPDFKIDAAFISKLYNYSQPNKVIEMTDQVFGLCAQYKSFKETAAIAEKEAKAAKAELLTLIGDAEKVVGPRFSISAGMIGPKHVEYDAEGYRDFRISVKKLKGEK